MCSQPPPGWSNAAYQIIPVRLDICLAAVGSPRSSTYSISRADILVGNIHLVRISASSASRWRPISINYKLPRSRWSLRAKRVQLRAGWCRSHDIIQFGSFDLDHIDKRCRIICKSTFIIQKSCSVKQQKIPSRESTTKHWLTCGNHLFRVITQKLEVASTTSTWETFGAFRDMNTFHHEFFNCCLELHCNKSRLDSWKRKSISSINRTFTIIATNTPAMKPAHSRCKWY